MTLLVVAVLALAALLAWRLARIEVLVWSPECRLGCEYAVDLGAPEWASCAVPCMYSGWYLAADAPPR